MPAAGAGMSEVADTAIVYPGTVVGEGCRILDYAVVGKQPTLSPRSTAKREDLPPLELGAGTIVSTGAVVFAGTTIGERVIVGDQACVRERCEIGAEAFVGAGAVVLRNVAPRAVVVGNPARPIREVPEDELL